jgi:hypothetical protein
MGMVDLMMNALGSNVCGDDGTDIWAQVWGLYCPALSGKHQDQHLEVSPAGISSRQHEGVQDSSSHAASGCAVKRNPGEVEATFPHTHSSVDPARFTSLKQLSIAPVAVHHQVSPQSPSLQHQVSPQSPSLHHQFSPQSPSLQHQVSPQSPTLQYQVSPESVCFEINQTP